MAAYLAQIKAPLLNLKSKGDLAELLAATDSIRRGYKVAFPYGEDWDYDLVVCRDGKLERVQVKYTRSDGMVLKVKCRSHSLTNGKVRSTKLYTARTIDWLAVYDATCKKCFYIPATRLGTGLSVLHLRLQPARNGQLLGTNPASRFTSI